MNVRHIGDIAVTSSVFLYKLSIREGGAWGECKRSSSPPQFSYPIHGLLSGPSVFGGGD